MKRVVISLTVLVASIFAMVGCEPVESNFSMQATYLYVLRADYGTNPSTTEIAVPNITTAQAKVDSVLSVVGSANKVVASIAFSSGGSSIQEMQEVLFKKISDTLGVLSARAETIDFAAELDQCKAYWGGATRIVLEVMPYGAFVPVMRDTIVEKLRINFVPAELSRWKLTEQDVEIERYDEYVFDQNNVVVLLHAGGDEPTTYTMDPETGIITVAAVSIIPQHTLTFKMDGGKPCLLSSLNDKLYFLRM